MLSTSFVRIVVVLSLLAAWPMVQWFGRLGAAHLLLYAAVNFAVSLATAARATA